MKSDVVLFQVSAAFALVLLSRHALRTFGRRSGGILMLYLVAMGVVRELLVDGLSSATNKPHPFAPDPTMLRIAGISVAVVGGWVFTTYVSFMLALMIQRRAFRGTNVFLTLALTALVTSAISYCVEVTGMRLGLWVWAPHSMPMHWLPFGWPLLAFDGWAATSFMIMLLYCSIRYRLFATTPWRSVAAGVGAFVIYSASDLTVSWFGPGSPRMKLTVVYIAAAVVLGFYAPRWMLGTSSEELGLAEGAPSP